MDKKTPLEKLEKEIKKLKERVKKLERILKEKEEEHNFDRWEGTDPE